MTHLQAGGGRPVGKRTTHTATGPTVHTTRRPVPPAPNGPSLPGLPPGQKYPELPLPRTAGRLAGGGLLIIVVLAVLGLALTRVTQVAFLTDWEPSANQWLVARSAPGWDAASQWGSRLAETLTALVLLVLGALALRWWLGRWRESWALAIALTGELLIFLAVSALVSRDRPDVRHLDAAPPTSSFPSGHTAASVALYGFLAVILWRQLPQRWWAAVAVGLLLLVPAAVGLARLYRGMHHPSDVLFGLVLGGAWLWLVVSTLLQRSPKLRAPDTPADWSAPAEPEGTTR